MGAYKEWEFKDITACEPPKVEQKKKRKKKKNLNQSLKNQR